MKKSKKLLAAGLLLLGIAAVVIFSFVKFGGILLPFGWAYDNSPSATGGMCLSNGVDVSCEGRAEGFPIIIRYSPSYSCINDNGQFTYSTPPDAKSYGTKQNKCSDRHIPYGSQYIGQYNAFAYYLYKYFAILAIIIVVPTLGYLLLKYVRRKNDKTGIS